MWDNRFLNWAVYTLVATLFLAGAWFGGKKLVHALTRHHATSGTVIDRNFEAAHDWIYMQPIPHTNCTSGQNGTSNCTTTYTYIPVPMHEPDRWSLRVRDDTDTEDDLGVPQSVYDSCPLDAYYPGEGAPCSP